MVRNQFGRRAMAKRHRDQRYAFDQTACRLTTGDGSPAAMRVWRSEERSVHVMGNAWAVVP